MINFAVFREVNAWKKPVHISRSLLARHYLKLLPNLEIIGVTGSVGKILTQNATAKVLSQKYKTIVGGENPDPAIRINKTILSAKPWHQKMILEYSVEHPLDMDHYLSIAIPKVAVVTTIAPTHIKYFGNMEDVAAEKVKLVASLPKNGHAVLNIDDPEAKKMADETKARIWFYGQNANDGVKISHFSQNLNGSKFRLHYNGQKASCSWKIIGRHQLLSAYAAATVGIIYGLTLKQIAKGLSLTKPSNHRLNLVKKGDITIIDDTYNASPKAAGESLNTLLDLGKRKKKMAVLGEMRDLGKISTDKHQSLGRQVAKSSVNYLVTIGNVAEEIGKSAKKNGFKGKIVHSKTIKKALNEIKKMILRNCIILIKGSRHAHLERITQGLLGKSTVVRCYQCGTLE